MELADVETIRAELAELQEKRVQVTEKLRSMDPRNRGGPGRGRGEPFGVERGRLAAGRGPGAAGRGFNEPHGMADRNTDRPGPAPFGREQIAEPVAPRRRLLSAVVVDGKAMAPGLQRPPEFEPPAISKRPPPDEKDLNPAQQKRNRRMFGALMGTLQRFKTDEKKERSSEVQRKRQEALQRAEQKAAEESARLKALFREKMQAERLAEIGHRRELSTQAEIKKVELVYAQRAAREKRLARWLKTEAQPALLWMPARQCGATQALAEQRQQQFEQWVHRESGALEAERQLIRDRGAAIAARAASRRQQQGNGQPANGAGEVAAATAGDGGGALEHDAEPGEGEEEVQRDEEVHGGEEEEGEQGGAEVDDGGAARVESEDGGETLEPVADASDRYVGGEDEEEGQAQEAALAQESE